MGFIITSSIINSIFVMLNIENNHQRTTVLKDLKISLGIESQKLYSTQRIIDECCTLNLPVQLHLNTQFHLKLNSPTPIPNNHIDFHLIRSTGTNLDDVDLVYARDCQNRGATIINSIENHQLFRNKDRALLELTHLGFPLPPTLILRSHSHEERKSILADFGSDQFVLKTFRGNGGIGVMQFLSLESLLSFFDYTTIKNDQRFIIQPLLKIKHEYRVLVIKDCILGAIEKKSLSQSFRKNASFLTDHELIFHPKLSGHLTPMLNLVEKIQQHFSFHFMGIDFIECEEGKWMLLEINPVPGFELFEKLSGLNVAKELLVKTVLQK